MTTHIGYRARAECTRYGARAECTRLKQGLYEQNEHQRRQVCGGAAAALAARIKVKKAAAPYAHRLSIFKQDVRLASRCTLQSTRKVTYSLLMIWNLARGSAEEDATCVRSGAKSISSDDHSLETMSVEFGK